MRKARVFVFRGGGFDIQLSQTAWDPPKPRVPRGKRAVPSSAEISAEIGAPFAAFRPPWETNGKLEAAPEPGGYRDPTDPDAPVDESALMQSELPEN